MPRLATFAGIVISIYAADHNPPHVHVSYGDFACCLEIATGVIIIGKMPTSQRKMAQKWLDANRDLCQAKWDELNG